MGFALCLCLLGGCKEQDFSYRIPSSGGEIVLTPLTDASVRVRFVKGEYKPLEEIVYTEKVRAPKFVAAEDAESIRLSIPGMTVSYDKNSEELSFLDASGNMLLKECGRSLEQVDVQGFPAFSATQSFVSPDDEFLYGTGQFQDGYLNVKGLTRRLTQVNTQIAIPFILSNKGYGLLWNNYGKTDFNPADNCVTLEQLASDGKSVTVNATGTSGNRRETRFYNSFSGELTVPESGRYALLLDVGQKMARRHFLAVDGEEVINVSNMWLPPTASVIVELEAGTHSLNVDGVRGDSPVVWWRAVDATTTFSSPVAQAVDYTVFAGNADQAIASYRTLTGKVPQMPDWMFGYIHCRERYHSSQEILENADGFIERNIPIDVIVQDWQWWGSTGWNSMEFDSENYPDPKALTDALHDRDMHLMLSVWSKIDKSSKLGAEFESKGYYIPETDWIDFMNPDAAAFYWDNFREKLVKPYGIDAWWLDATEPENDDLDGRMVMNGSLPGAFYRNAYPLFVSRAVYEGFRKDVPERTPVILTRSAFPGMQRYGSVTWSGDIGNDFKTLRYQIAGGLGQMAAGLPWWTYDAGGFFRPGDQYTDKAYQERMIRWIQASVFLPFMRVHGYMSETEPWRYEEETYDEFVRCIRLREALLPYILKCAKAVSTENSTMMRPLVFDFPSDVEALKQDCEFMFGPSLLVCPVTEEAAASWKVYLPVCAEGWVDLWTGEKFEGGKTIDRPVDINTIPVYVKSGAAKEISGLVKDFTR